MDFAEILKLVIAGENIGAEKSGKMMELIMDGALSEAQMAAYLVALEAKGVSVEELSGAAAMMREKALKISPDASVLIDTCGTGGDHSGSFNISTLAAIVAASLDISVAKHGNRAASGKCGSADVLEVLGVKIDLSPDKVQKCIEEINIGFLFAPLFHPAMKHVAPVRSQLKIRTIFNLLGPLCNPAQVTRQCLGVFDADLCELMIEVLKDLGCERAMVFHGNGFDEISITGKTLFYELKEGMILKSEISPEDFGIELAEAKDIAGGDKEVNKQIFLEVLRGNKGPKRDIVLLNSAAAVLVADRARDWDEAISMCREAIESEKALAKLNEFVKFSNSI